MLDSITPPRWSNDLPPPPQRIGTGIELGVLFDALSSCTEAHAARANRFLTSRWVPSLAKNGALDASRVEDLLDWVSEGVRGQGGNGGNAGLWRSVAPILRELDIVPHAMFPLPPRHDVQAYGGEYLSPAEVGALVLWLTRIGFPLDWQSVIAAVPLPAQEQLHTRHELRCRWARDLLAIPIEVNGAGLDDWPGRWCRVARSGALAWLCDTRLRVLPAGASRRETANVLRNFHDPATVRLLTRSDPPRQSALARQMRQDKARHTRRLARIAAEATRRLEGPLRGLQPPPPHG